MAVAFASALAKAECFAVALPAFVATAGVDSCFDLPERPSAAGTEPSSYFDGCSMDAAGTERTSDCDSVVGLVAAADVDSAIAEVLAPDSACSGTDVAEMEYA